MKLSRYNIEKKEDKSCLIYNTVTSAILELDTDLYETLYLIFDYPYKYYTFKLFEV